MKTLVILAHPHLDRSRVNLRWKKELSKHSDAIRIHELYTRYPDGVLDVAEEQRLLEEHDLVILQFPLYWYSYPPLLKQWLDEVWTYGWAYGTNGDKLKGKTFGLAISIGDKIENYRPEGSVSFTVDEVLAPFKASAKHVGARVLPYFAIFSASFQASDAAIDQSAKDYIHYITQHQSEKKLAPDAV